MSLLISTVKSTYPNTELHCNPQLLRGGGTTKRKVVGNLLIPESTPVYISVPLINDQTLKFLGLILFSPEFAP